MTTTPSTPSSSPTPVLDYATAERRRRLPQLRGLWDAAGMLVIFLLLFAGCSLFVPNFFSFVNMTGLALSVATVGIIACTMLFCLAAGDFDLSVGSVVAMSGVLAAAVVNRTGSVSLGIGCGILAGGAVGLVNGFVIAKLEINALITTLATMQIVRGLAFIACDGRPIGVINENFFTLGISSFLGVPTPVWIMLGCFVVFGVLLNRTIFGRNTLAVGGNKEAAYLAGIRVTRLKIVIFTLQGLIAAFAGVILASRMTSGQPNTGQGLELQVISACVLGGVSLSGGVGTMLGVVVGVLIMGTVNNAMNLLNIPPFYQYVASGGILLAAVLFDRLKQHRTV
jgi:L-arabinose transport system permease protein